MLTKRIIPCLDIKDGRVVKGVRFEQLRDSGDPAELAARYDLGYLSTDASTNGAWREGEIRGVRPDLKGAKVRTRAGYYGPYQPQSPRNP